MCTRAFVDKYKQKCMCAHAYMHMLCVLAGADAEIAGGGFVQHELLVRGMSELSIH